MRLTAIVPAALLTLLSAASPSVASVRFTTTDFRVGEGDGAATIAVARDSANGRGEVRYAVWHRSADHRLDYTPVRGVLEFAAGQTQATFAVPVADDANVESDETAVVGVYGSYPERIGQPNRATLTIVDNDAVSTERDALNPLGLDPPPPADNPLEGATFYTNPSTNLAGLIIRQIRGRKPQAAQLLQTIADQPETKRFGAFNDQPGAAVAQYLARAAHQQPGSIPLISTYRLKHVECGGYSDTPDEVDRYKGWYEKLAQGIGNHRVVVFLEIDALITTKCLSRAGGRRRLDEVRSAIGSLAALPHAVVYVDAGAGDAHNGPYIAKLLRKIDVFRIQGFFTNSTHQNWTRREIRYGRDLIRRLGGRPHHVINTAANGRGPLIPKSRVRFGNSFRCNAPGRGLGPRPTAYVPPQYRNLDALIWIGNPGRSAGRCVRREHGTPPPAGEFWVDYAVQLVRNADFRIR